jgi:TPR repeat protein
VQGHAGAQADLGKMYGQGRGVPKDLVASYKWLALARTNARTAAVRTGAAKSLERLAAAMTPAQISDAQRLAREWRPVRPKGGSP